MCALVAGALSLGALPLAAHADAGGPDEGVVTQAMAADLSRMELGNEVAREPIRSAAAAWFLMTLVDREPDRRAADGRSIAARVAEHISNLVVAGNEPVCSGGLDTIATNAMIQTFALAKESPAVWSLLDSAAKEKVGLLVRACLVASHWLHDDDNNFSTGLNQLGNTNKTWNPNHVEGGIGMGLAAAHFLGAAEAQGFLDSFDADAFVAQLQAANLPSAAWVMDQTAPDVLEAATRDKFTFQGHGLDDPWSWVAYRSNIMYSGVVAPTGAGGKGYILAGADGLPNRGELGMALEFESIDGGGPRSDIHYVARGWNNSFMNLWFANRFSEPANNVDSMLRRYTVGTTDFLYKAKQGYHSWALNKDKGDSGEQRIHDDIGLRYLSEAWRLAPSLHREADQVNEVVRPASGDAYVRGGSNATQNYGAVGRLEVKHDANDAFARQSLVAFDLTGFQNVDEVRLDLRGYVDVVGGSAVVEIATTDPAWQESTVTWATRPATRDVVGSVAVDATDKVLSVDVSAAVSAALAAGQTSISFVLRLQATGASGPYTLFSSREGSYAPTLVGVEPVDEPLGADGIAVTVPEAGPVDGAFGWTFAGTAPVSLGTAQQQGGMLTAAGRLNDVIVEDTRSGGTTPYSWSIAGRVTDFISADGSFSGDRLGWTPRVNAGPESVTAGPAEQSVTRGGRGLAAQRALASSSAAASSVVSADLELALPLTTSPGDYVASVVLTALQ